MSEATLGCSSFCPHLMSRSHGTVHSPLNGAYHVIQERNGLYKVDFKVENYDFSVSRGRRLEKGREFAISGHQRRIMDTPWLADDKNSRLPRHFHTIQLKYAIGGYIR